MNAKRKVKCGVGFVFMIFLSIFGMGNEAPGKTINLSGLTSPTGDYRWRDVADQLYSQSYQTSYNYTQANVAVTYDPAAPTLRGTLTATNLKPNFAYQLKLAGSPGTAANEHIGLAGRWWQEEWNGSAWTNGQNLNNKGNGSSPNPNDIIYFQNRDIVNATSPTGLKYRYTGYLVFDYFITDENGNAVLNFETNSSYHVLWKTSQRSATPSDGPVKSRSFDADPSLSPAYDTDYPPQTINIFGEWERLPVGGVHLQVGDYLAQIILTEESFHGSGGPPYAGNWAGAMGAQIDFSLYQEYIVTTDPPNLQITVDGSLYTTPHMFRWPPMSTHTISTSSPQFSADGRTQYSFSSWDDGGGQTHQITVPSSAMTYTASFTAQFLLDTKVNPAGSGNIALSPNGPWYNPNQVVQLTATPVPGYTLSSWSGDLIGATNPASITMSGSKAVTANFTQNQYTLSITIAPSSAVGSVTSNPNKATYAYGDVVTLSAIANPGYTFANWTGDVPNPPNPINNIQITISGNTSVTANFKQNEKPDLIVSSLTGPPYPYMVTPGQVINLSEATKNQGTVTAGASVTKFYWSTNRSL